MGGGDALRVSHLQFVDSMLIVVETMWFNI